MNIILLSGGSGKRLWPLSNDVRSKQFIKLFKKPDMEYESMVQRICRQVCLASPGSTITVATGKTQKSAVKNQLGDDVGICVEPSRRDTFPAIALACAYMYSEKGLSPEDVVIVCPVDPYVEEDYFLCLQQLEEVARHGAADLVLMGAKPTYPSEKYGYILPEPSETDVKSVESFREKPDKAAAEELIRMGGLWNCGVFAFKLGYLLSILHRHIEYDSYADVYTHYDKLPKTSFDYAVVEKEVSVQCVVFDGQWKDVGTWNTLTEVMEEPVIGPAAMDGTCENVHIINELDIPILAMGCRDMVIAAGPDGILVSDKEQSSLMKPYVEAFDHRAMYEEHSWGELKVLSVDEHSMTTRLSISAGKAMRYTGHPARSTVWTVLYGRGVATMDGEEKPVAAGGVLRPPKGQQLALVATEDIEIVEIQLGEG